MNKNFLIHLVLFAWFSHAVTAQNTMPVPPALTGENITLTLQEGTSEFYTGVTTNTMGANGALLGPTLILNKDSFVSIVVDNQLQDSTTIHWHGMHVSPENDGGPHTVIASGTTWNPQFTVLDKAGINWYHPHLHMQTDKHVSKGIAGLIIVKDAEEQALNLPDDYGVDDFPIVLQTKGFDASGQIEIHTELDTSVLVNGVVNATVDMPAQVIRMRILNGSTQRVMEIGFSDNRSFSLIGTDGGLLTAPVNLTRYRMAPGQRADVLLDLSGSLGENFQLMSFASELPNAVYGSSQPGMGPGLTGTLPGYTSNPLNGNDYQFLDINVVAQSGSPVLSIPATLANFSPIAENEADLTRSLTFSMSGGMTLAGPFLINGSSFDMETINYEVPLNNTEIWSLTNQTPIAHPFHIHDVQFFILDINGNPPPAELQGYNDVVLVPGGMGTVRFIARFEDFSSNTVPYMYHCHMLTHEDDGMMGQFLVVEEPQSILENSADNYIRVFPNPNSNGQVYIRNDNPSDPIISYKLYTADGRLLESKSIDNTKTEVELKVSDSGLFLLQLFRENSTVSRKIIVR
jgi:bilirubin oxidase